MIDERILATWSAICQYSDGMAANVRVLVRQYLLPKCQVVGSVPSEQFEADDLSSDLRSRIGQGEMFEAGNRLRVVLFFGDCIEYAKNWCSLPMRNVLRLASG